MICVVVNYPQHGSVQHQCYLDNWLLQSLSQILPEHGTSLIIMICINLGQLETSKLKLGTQLIKILLLDINFLLWWGKADNVVSWQLLVPFSVKLIIFLIGLGAHMNLLAAPGLLN